MGNVPGVNRFDGLASGLLNLDDKALEITECQEETET